MHHRRIPIALALLAAPTLVGCNAHPIEPICYQHYAESTTEVSLESQRKVDILFVIDNSGSMGEEQAALAANFQAFVGALEAEDVDADYRIGITTTDDGNPWCQGTGPESGKLQLRSCRDHIGDFVFSPGSSSEIDRRAVACEERCPEDLAGLTTLATATDLDPEARARPWLQRGNGLSNVPEGVSTAEALACWGPQGINGCGYESPLESMRKAVTLSGQGGADSYGFLRDDALLQVVFITDEADCSAGPGSAAAFDPNGSRALWPDPDAPLPPSALCWNAGVSCTTGDDGRTRCEPAELNAEGQPAADGEEVLHPLSRYIEVLDAIDQHKRNVIGQDSPQVLVSVIAGVPTEYAGQDLDYGPGSDPAFEADFGVGAGCSSGNGQAVPPVRLRAMADAFADEPGTNLFSICDEDYSPALEAIADILIERLRPSCIDACVAGVADLEQGKLDACTIVQDDGSASREVVPCEQASDGSYQRPDGEDLCVHAVTAEDMHEDCQADGRNVELRFVRAPGVGYGNVTATCEISATPQLDCPAG